MAGNSIGKEFVVTTFGESHGKVVGVVVDGCPAGLPLSEGDFQEELDRRIPAEPKIVSGRVEKDVAKILSGVFNGFTTGAPIALTVENKETNPVITKPSKTCQDQDTPTTQRESNTAASTTTAAADASQAESQ